MATPNAALAFHVSGQLAKDVTDITIAYPHGGTALGAVGEVQVRRPRSFRILTREENNAPYDIVWLGGALILGCRIRGWDSDAVASLIPGGSAGATGPRIDWPESTIGKVPTPLTNVAFTPFNAAYPSIIVRRPHVVPDPASDIEMRLAAGRWLDIRVALIATLDANDELGEMGQAADLVV